MARVAREHGLERSQLQSRLEGHGPTKRREPPHKRLSDPEEVVICRHIDRLDALNMAVRPEFITEAANRILLARCWRQDSLIPLRLDQTGHPASFAATGITSSARKPRRASGSTQRIPRPLKTTSTSSLPSSKSMGYSLRTYGIWTRRGFESGWARASLSYQAQESSLLCYS